MIGMVTLVGIILSNIMFPGKLMFQGFIIKLRGITTTIQYRYRLLASVSLMIPKLSYDRGRYSCCLLVIQMISDIGEKPAFKIFHPLYLI